jgi:hypothetical protein
VLERRAFRFEELVMTISIRTALILILAAAILALPGCGGKESMASRSEAAFREAQAKGLPIDKGEHGGHQNSEAGEMSHPETGDMKGMDMSGMKPGGMKSKDMSTMKHGDMKGMNMSTSKHGDMKGMDMSGMKHGDMKGMDMSAMKHGDMKGMDMSGTKPGDMKGMDMTGVEMSPVVPQPLALQPKPGEAATTLRADPLDAPAMSSVTAAQQSGKMNTAMASGEGGMTMSMGSYVQHDVGRQSSSSEPMKKKVKK